MRGRTWVVCVACALPLSCNAGQVLKALASTALTVAVGAALRANPGNCYATCAYGTVCNPSSGLCEPEKEKPTPWSKGRGYDEENDWPPDEDCGGLCLEHEVCNVTHDALVCVPRSAP